MRDAVDIGAWLRQRGLERYEQAFRDNAVDFDILSELAETDLEELGVLWDDRKKLLDAITELAHPTKPRPESQDRLPTSSALEPSGGN